MRLLLLVTRYLLLGSYVAAWTKELTMRVHFHKDPRMEGRPAAFPPLEPEPGTQIKGRAWPESHSLQEAKLEFKSKWPSLEVSKFVTNTL